MSFSCRYRGEFYDLSYSASTQGLLWTTEIEEDAYTGSVTDMKMGGQPLVIEHMASGDDLLLTPVKGSRATINIWSETQFQYTSLYSYENFKYRVSIYYGDAKTLYWRGYLTTEYTEQYDDTPYEVSVTASDGLGLLKDILYDDDGTLYTGRQYESQIILNILGKLGFTEFTEYCNIYDTLMASGTGDSPFDQCQIDQDVFVNSDWTAMDCYTVLSEILKKYNAVIRQVRGVFVIYRPIELIGTTVYGRHFTAYNTKSSVSITPQQIIRGTTISDWNGGTLMLQSPLSEFTVEQDYGNRESWIDNHNFDISTWDRTIPASQHFKYWTHLGCEPVSYEHGLESETQGIKFDWDGTGKTFYAYQTFGDNAKACANTFIFSFDYRMIKRTSGSASNVSFAIEVRDVANTYWLDQTSDIEAHWDNSAVTVNYTIATVPQGLGEWTTYQLSIAGLPADGPYIITLHATNTSAVRIAYKNVRFYSTADEIVLKTVRNPVYYNILRLASVGTIFGSNTAFAGAALAAGNAKTKKIIKEINSKDVVVSRTYTASNAISAPKSGTTYILGDCEDTTITNVVEQFKGSLAVKVTGSLSQSATDFVTDFAADYLTGDVIVTSDGPDIIFTSSIAGTNFTGNTTITNVSGDLDGTVVATQANQTAQVQIETMTLSGGTGAGDDGLIFLFSIWWNIDFNTSLTQTAADFVTNYAGTIAGYNCTVTSSGADIIFTETTALGGFAAPQFEWDAGSDLRATIVHTQAAAAAQARIDTVTLEGTSGTANILCDGKTHLVTFYGSDALNHTSSWHTRGNTENLPLAELTAKEVIAAYAREKHFLQANLRESSVTAPDVNVIYNFKDYLNTFSGIERIFACNRGTFDVKAREWQIDLHEIFQGLTGYYYIATTGSDTTGNGSYTNPWASLYYASTQVTTAGKTIYVMPGTYTETARSNLAVGVSIVGTGATSIIRSTYAATHSYDGSIFLESSNAGTNGNQSISYICLDGASLTGLKAIQVNNRSNVSIHHCTIQNFAYSAVGFYSTNYETGNTVHGCKISNCSTRNSPLAAGHIILTYQSDILIYNNTFIQNTRAAGENGNIINGVGGYIRGLKYYNNKSYKTQLEGTDKYNFHIELWNTTGGNEFYNNEFYGGTAINIAGLTNTRGTYTYNSYIHNNLFELSANPAFQDPYNIGIAIEGSSADIIITRNYFKKYPFGVTFSMGINGQTTERISISYNIFEDIGWNNSTWCAGIWIYTERTATYQNINIYNNVLDGTANAGAGIFMNTAGTISTINIINNIIQNIGGYGAIAFWSGAGTIGTINVQNNILYNNVNSNALHYEGGKVVTNLDTYNPGVDIDDNSNADPLVVGVADFHLQAGSPCINAGQNVGLLTDYEGDPVGNPPEIGAYEYN